MAIRRHLAYASYVFRHKWFVLVAGLKVGAPFWRLLVHDWSKFLPCEWFPYARTFYAPDGTKQYKPDAGFDRAWLHHQHHNPHHWQSWLLREDSGNTRPLPIPENFAREMVADWMGAGRAIHGKWEVNGWYRKNGYRMLMNPDTRTFVEKLINFTP